MKTRFITGLAAFLGCGFLITPPLEVGATEGAFHDNAGQSPANTDKWRSLADNGSGALADKRYDLAIRFFTAALDLRPKNNIAASLYQLRGDAYLEKGERDKARADYDRAVNFVPKDFEDYLNRGSGYEKKGNYKAAASDYAKAEELSPDSAAALNALAWFKATCPERSLRDGRDAVRAGTKACELTRWRDSSVIDTLAAAHAEAGNFDQAVKYEEQAIKMRSTSPDDRKEMEERLALYRQRKPYRNKSKLAAG